MWVRIDAVDVMIVVMDRWKFIVYSVLSLYIFIYAPSVRNLDRDKTVKLTPPEVCHALESDVGQNVEGWLGGSQKIGACGNACQK